MDIGLQLCQIEAFLNFPWAEVFRSVLVKDDSLDWNVSSDICVNLFLDLGGVGPSWILLGASVNTESVEWW